jgi:integrase
MSASANVVTMPVIAPKKWVDGAAAPIYFVWIRKSSKRRNGVTDNALGCREISSGSRHSDRRDLAGSAGSGREAEQLEAFMTAAKAHGSREWATFVFAFSHGGRASEICDLRWSDVNFHTKQVTIARKKQLPGADAGVPEG